jgi:dolichyl-phosphate beta-glucosyltransferase
MSNPYFSVVIPAYNESFRIVKPLTEVCQYFAEQEYPFEIIVVDDGSSDDTSAVISKHFPKIKLISYKINQGKGFAVKTGIASAKGEFILMCDADNATPIIEIERLLPYAHEYPLIIGSRYLPGSNIMVKQPITRVIGSRLFNLLVQLILLPGFPDTQCGFKLFSAKAADKIFSKLETKRWGFDLEVLVRAKKAKLKIKQVPVDWYDQPGSRIQSMRVFFNSIVELLKIKRDSLRW